MRLKFRKLPNNYPMMISDRRHKRFFQQKKGIFLPIFLIFAIFITLTIMVFPVSGEEETETSLTDFTLYRYPKETKNKLFWKLTGERAKREDDLLTVHGFQLDIMESKSDNYELLYELHGDKIELGGKKGVPGAFMPGKIEIIIGKELNGNAKDVRYDFRTGKLSGEKIELTGSKSGNKIELSGTEFGYSPESSLLRIQVDFRIEIIASGKTRSVITGRSLSWPRSQEIIMSGDISARLSSSWQLESDRLTWWPEKGVFESKKGGTIEREGTKINGKMIKYEAGKEKLLVSNAKMVIGDG